MTQNSTVQTETDHLNCQNFQLSSNQLSLFVQQLSNEQVLYTANKT